MLEELHAYVAKAILLQHVPANVRRSLDNVCSARQLSLDALSFADAQVAASRGIGVGSRVSMGIWNSEVRIIDWNEPTAGTGRVIHLDAHFKLVFPMPWKNPWADYTKSELILRDVGLRVRRVNGQYREQIARSFLKVRHIPSSPQCR